MSAHSSQQLKRILSIQSHVVHGYVGNRAAVFPLQLLGNDVDFINTVQFSNHTGYPLGWTGEVLSSAALLDLYEGMKRNGLHRYDYVLSGYIGNRDTLNALLTIVRQMREENPDLVFFCDPVMGDDGQFYVPEESVNVYKDQLLAMADIITPNSFEAELLTGMKITTKEEAIVACHILHSKGVRNVIITGIASPDEKLILVGSFVDKLHPDKREVISIQIPKLDCKFTGAGDIFSALLLGWIAKDPLDMKGAVERAVSTTYSVLKKTYDCGGGELRIIESKNVIESPVILFTAARESP